MKDCSIDSSVQKLYQYILFLAIMATGSGAVELACFSGVAPLISGLQTEAYRRFCSFKQKCCSAREFDLFDWKSKLQAFTRSISEILGTFGGRFFHPRKG